MAHDPERLEGQLRALTPSGPTLNRDALLIQMGRASAPPRWPWQVASSLLLVLALGLGVAWWHERAREPLVIERVVERQVIVPVPASPPSLPSVSPHDPLVDTWPRSRKQSRHLLLQDHLLRFGLEGLGQNPPASTPSLTLDELLESLSITTHEEP